MASRCGLFKKGLFNCVINVQVVENEILCKDIKMLKLTVIHYYNTYYAHILRPLCIFFDLKVVLIASCVCEITSVKFYTLLNN